MNYKVGITGNYYFTSQDKAILEAICAQIGKAKSSVYWNTKYSTYVIRVKSKQHKRKVKQLQWRGDLS